MLSILDLALLSAPISPARRAALADTLRQLRDYMAERTLYSGLAALFNVKVIFPGHLSWNTPSLDTWPLRCQPLAMDTTLPFLMSRMG